MRLGRHTPLAMAVVTKSLPCSLKRSFCLNKPVDPEIIKTVHNLSLDRLKEVYAQQVKYLDERTAFLDLFGRNIGKPTLLNVSSVGLLAVGFAIEEPVCLLLGSAGWSIGSVWYWIKIIGNGINAWQKADDLAKIERAIKLQLLQKQSTPQSEEKHAEM